jgi:DNA topoisomerase-1
MSRDENEADGTAEGGRKKAAKKKAPGKKKPKAEPPAKADEGAESGEAPAVAPAKKKAAPKKKAAAKTPGGAKAAAPAADDEGAEEATPTKAAKKKAGKKAPAGKTAAKKAPASKKKAPGKKRGAEPGMGDLLDEPVDGYGDAEEGGDDTDGEEAGTGRALVIVESPAKAKTINKYLGSGYRVIASMGHVRDIPKERLGIDVDNQFEVEYEPIAEKKKVIGDLRKFAKNAREIFLCPDPDREGEAIAWHIAELIRGQHKGPLSRVTFNQITKEAIQKAFEHPRAIDMNKVNAQQARRVLDRLVGYKLSQLLWKKVRRGLSAGRVQSVAVKLVVERELEIQAFRPKEYWEIDGLFDSPRLRGSEPPAPVPPPPAEGSKEPPPELPPYRFQAKIVTVKGEKIDTDDRPLTAAEAAELDASLPTAAWRVASVVQRERSSKPRPPFITSSLQQAASSELSFGAKRTMQVAQGLYEGVDIGSEGTVGLITYMRTDSFALAPEAVAEARTYIDREFGKAYLPEAPNVYKRVGLKVQAQEAHEAIRPTSVDRTPDSLAAHLSPEQLRLYTLIWRRFVACQMTPARFMGLTVDVAARLRAASDDAATFRATGSTLLFDGHLKVSGRDQSDRLLPPLVQDEALDLVPPLVKAQKFTQPPARFSEASLVKKLEAEGIGRPSTYAAIIQTIQDRGYVSQVSRAFHATTKGIIVTKKLEEFFGNIMSYGYTRDLETNLDRVEGAVEQTDAASDVDADDSVDIELGEGKTLSALDWRELLAAFYKDFSSDLDKAMTQMKGVNEEPQVTDYPCPKCGAMMVKMFNTREFSQFLGCPNYKDGCKTTVPLDENGKPAPAQEIDAKCPKCGKQLVSKSGRRGRFFACSGYPECKETFECGPDGLPLPKPQIQAECPKCKGDMTVRKGRTGSFLGCTSYPECKGTLPLVQNPDGTWAIGQRAARREMPDPKVKCEQCGSPMAIKMSRRGPFLGCSAYPKCKATGKLPEGIELPKREPPKLFGEDCDQCGKPLVVREGQRGPFVSCSGYPKCRNTKNLPPNWVPPAPAPAAPAAAPTP